MGDCALDGPLNVLLVVAVQAHRQNLGGHHTERPSLLLGLRGALSLHGLSLESAVVMRPVIALYGSKDEVPVLHCEGADTTILDVIILKQLDCLFLNAFGDVEEELLHETSLTSGVAEEPP